MSKLVTYTMVSLDAYFADANGDMSWAHKKDPEWQAFVSDNAGGGGRLLFGRVTYDLMASFWPTPFAAQSNPIVVERMNGLPKIVFSRTLDKASWLVLGNGRTLFEGVKKKLPMKLTKSRAFGNGNVVLCYEPMS